MCFLCVFLIRKELLEADRTSREQQQVAKVLRKWEIITAVREQSGLCKTAAEVDCLLEKFKSTTSKLKALSLQLRYHREVVGSSNKLLTKSKFRLNVIRDNLVHCLDSEPEAFHMVPAELTAAVLKNVVLLSLFLMKQSILNKGSVWPYSMA